MDWTELGAVPPKSLASTRLLLHWAAQLPSAAGATLIPARKDASETSLSWDEGSLVGAPIGDKHAAIRFADLRLFAGKEEMPLAGKTMAEALDWLGERFGKKLERPKHELPDHPVSHGAPFTFGEGERKAPSSSHVGTTMRASSSTASSKCARTRRRSDVGRITSTSQRSSSTTNAPSASACRPGTARTTNRIST